MLEINFQPFPTIATERLLLRQLNESDSEAILKIRSDEKVSQFIARQICTTIVEAKEFINKINNNISKNESMYWGITLASKNRNEFSNEVIGTICIWNISKEDYRAEIGYELLPDFHGKGIMQEALASVLDYGFRKMKLHSIEGKVDSENIASIKLLEKNNFIREAYFKENIYFNGRFMDTAIYSLINPLEFENGPTKK